MLSQKRCPSLLEHRRLQLKGDCSKTLTRSYGHLTCFRIFISKHRGWYSSVRGLHASKLMCIQYELAIASSTVEISIKETSRHLKFPPITTGQVLQTASINNEWFAIKKKEDHLIGLVAFPFSWFGKLMHIFLCQNIKCLRPRNNPIMNTLDARLGK